MTLLRYGAAAPVLALALLVSAAGRADQAQLDRGAYLFSAADCGACHTNVKEKGPLLGGGRPQSAAANR